MKKKLSLVLAFLPFLAGCGCSPNGDSIFDNKVTAYFFIAENDPGYSTPVLTLLYHDENVKKGSTPVYGGQTPTKPSTDIESYTFAGWEPELGPIYEDTNYYAKFTSTLNKYTVTWLNEDGEILKVDENVEALTVPEYTGETPTKEGNAQYSFTFKDWDKERVAVRSDQVYKATYERNVNQYTVTFQNYDGKVISEQTVDYNEYPTLPSETPEKPGDDLVDYYPFVNWDKPILPVTENVTYTATFKEYTEQNVLKYVLSSDGTYYIVAGFIEDTLKTICKKVVIPDTYEGLPVKHIDTMAFYKCNFSKLELGNNIDIIGNNAFNLCTNLEDFLFPNSLKEIGNYAFDSCTSLTHINLSNNIERIGIGAFRKCANITEMHLPFIGEKRSDTANTFFKYIFGSSSYSDKAAYMPTKIEKLVLDDGCERVYVNAFVGVTNIIENYYFSKNLGGLDGNMTTPSAEKLYFKGDLKDWLSLTLGNGNGTPLYLFENGEYVEFPTELVIPEGVTKINQFSLSCRPITSVSFPNSLLEIDNYAFSYCKDLTTVVLPTNLTKIGEHAFDNCTALTSITFNENLKEIGGYAFYFCSALTGVALPEGLTTISSGAFAACPLITTFKVPDSVTDSSGVIFAFTSTNNVSDYDIGNGLTSLNSNFAIQHANVTHLHIGSGLTGGLESFIYRLTKLEELTISSDNPSYMMEDGIVYNKDKTKLVSALWMINNPTSFTIPASVTEISDYAFYNCQALTEVTIHDEVKKIGERSFQNCGFTTLTIPDTVEYIGYGALEGCSQLTELTVPFSGQTIESSDIHFGYIFGDNSYTQNNKFPNGLTTINITGDQVVPSNCFYQVYKVKNINLLGDVPSIAFGAFKNCYVQRLNTPVLGDGGTNATIKYMYGVSKYDDSQTYGINHLRKVTLRKGTEIVEGAFYGCSQLCEVEFPDTLTTIGTKAFWGCNHLCSFKIPSSVTSIADNTFNSSTDSSSERLGNYCLTYILDEAGLITTYNQKKALGLDTSSVEIESSAYSIYYYSEGFYCYSQSGNRVIVGYIGESNSITITNGYSKVASYAFYANPDIEEFTVSDSYTTFETIEMNAFDSCSKLKKVYTGSEISYINAYAFRGCKSLDTLILGAKLNRIYSYAFYDCSSLTTIKFKSTKAVWGSITKGSGWHYNVPSTTKVTCTDGSIDL